MKSEYLPDGLPTPILSSNSFDAEFWSGTAVSELRIQRCSTCCMWRWGPEPLCHNCHSFHYSFEKTDPTGVIYSWALVSHGAHPAFKDSRPYYIVLVELPEAGGVRVVGNYPESSSPPTIGCCVTARFEQRKVAGRDAEKYTLVQWVPI